MSPDRNPYCCPIVETWIKCGILSWGPPQMICCAWIIKTDKMKIKSWAVNFHCWLMRIIPVCYVIKVCCLKIFQWECETIVVHPGQGFPVDSNHSGCSHTNPRKSTLPHHHCSRPRKMQPMKLRCPCAMTSLTNRGDVGYNLPLPSGKSIYPRSAHRWSLILFSNSTG